MNADEERTAEGMDSGHLAGREGPLVDPELVDRPLAPTWPYEACGQICFAQGAGCIVRKCEGPVVIKSPLLPGIHHADVPPLAIDDGLWKP